MRELRQHASRYLAKVKAGETVEVTERGQPIARLVPIESDYWQDLIRSGQVIPAASDIDLRDIKPMKSDFSASAELARMREHER